MDNASQKKKTRKKDVFEAIFYLRAIGIIKLERIPFKLYYVMA
jgi:hypothetical protein